MLSRRYESNRFVESSADRVFDYVDDHQRLSGHMSKSSWKMGGGRFSIEVDEGRGRTVGSRIRLAGRVLGVALSVEEIVTERDPPHRKVWHTTGNPKLLVLGQYQMGFVVVPHGKGSMLRVFIEYTLPEYAPGSWLGRVFGRYYARWCVDRMVHGAVEHFASRSQ